ncbi:MAG: sugar ABC transporter ATP-binding protein [Acidobacteriota bacterium]
MTDASPLLRVSGLCRSYPGVRALHEVDLDACEGEVLALLGENGAGKSTLLKIVSGAETSDAGTVELRGSPLPRSPAEVTRAGVVTIYQELSLVPQLSVRQNLFLGREPVRRFGFVDRDEERRRAELVLERLGLDVDLDTPVRELEVARQQLVEIARALLADAALLIMDEPTAALTPREVERLFVILRELRADGLGIVFVSHRLDEIDAIADRIVVLRDGESVGCWSADALSRDELIEAMVGRPLDQEHPKQAAELGEIVLEVEGLCGGPVRDVSFQVRAGEIVGLAGLVGAGRTEVARLVFGADRATAGTVRVDGEVLNATGPRDAIGAGVALLTEDRKAQGLVLALSSRENFALGNLDRWSRGGLIDGARERSVFAGHVERLGIRVSGPEQPAGTLSGGNQQKLLVARWLERDCRVLLFDEPTRGIDVGARHEIYLLLNELASRGKAIVMISSELPEVLGMSDRILVMNEGRLRGEVDDVASATQESLLALAVS